MPKTSGRMTAVILHSASGQRFLAIYWKRSKELSARFCDKDLSNKDLTNKLPQALSAQHLLREN
jgi:hypothetical protein